ncbi:transcriptional regulator, LacI family [Chitinophaga jiangningensis]|uniref:Transcriptional regulator, LacI family n=1 Tax=Chitinophaga jiangningensis TaxID=1419482 RepID=A0A1M7JBF5_9BACT|nr:LacI family DNA-binding transcriptional regulator [Chitinophaga jiangningensis]SHM50213.1 transcriptional regulator, LacI family [Chitinophaga jiangningensis]
MKKKVSIHDIAKALHLSAATISFVLNGKADEKKISGDVRKKVLDYIKKVGYQPNMIAKSLRTGKSNIIGMLVEDIADPFFSGISRGIESIAYHHQYKIFFASTENDVEKTRTLIRAFRERQVDGYIIAPPPGVEEEIQALMDDNVPVILFDRYLPVLNTSSVIVDNYAGAYQAVKHLKENGYAHIAFITLQSEQTQMMARLQGYHKAMEDRDCTPLVARIPYELSHHDSAAQLVAAFIKANDHIDAIIFATNYLAINGLRAISSLGLTIPENIAVVGFDDNTHFNLFSPSITAVAQPIEEIAQEVVLQLLSALSDEKENKKRRTVTLPVKLVIRNSSFPKAKLEQIHTETSVMKNS